MIDETVGDIRVRTAILHLDRKTGGLLAGDEVQINAIRELLAPAVLHDMANRKAACRELVAEIGDLDQDMLKRGVSVLGIDIATERHMRLLEQALVAIHEEAFRMTGRDRLGRQGDVRE